jgi:hypothetical protein
MVIEFSVNSANSAKVYSCLFCNITCSRKNDWDRHIITRKHLGNTSINKLTIKKSFTCAFCSKEYKSRKGLWSHNKTCTSSKQIVITSPVDTNEIDTNEIDTNEIDTNEIDTNEIDTSEIDTNELVDEKHEKDKVIQLLIKENYEFKNIVLEIMKSNSDLQKQNNEIQKQMIEVCKNNSINTINSHNNNNNKTFNLQFFLNEQCKDAMNITDFANSFDLQLSDLETVGELGYVNGITKIMVDKLNSMDIYKRPIHCSDAKREIIYVKDANVWTKEEKDNPKLRQAIKSVSFRNMKLVYNWSNAYPESKDNESRLNDKYMQLVIQSTGGNNPIVESENKIIRRIAKEIVIGKNNF